jgi:chemotaxis protein MotB
MSNGQEDVSSQPLVIVRRRRNTEEAHHGGVWKIAYADFMTAMMAFFLVMWLINAADKKTIVQVANYFNPIRLTDRFAAPKGLNDLSEIEPKQSDRKAEHGRIKQIQEKDKPESQKESKQNVGDAMDEAAQKKSAAAGGKSEDAQKEEALFDNPGQLLDTLAEQAKASQSLTAASPADGNVSDPFDRINRRAGRSKETQQPATQPAPSPRAAPGKAQERLQPESKTGTDKNANPLPHTIAGNDQKQSGLTVASKDGKQIQSVAPVAPEPAPAVPKTDKAMTNPGSAETPPNAAKIDNIEKRPDSQVEATKLATDISSAISQVSKQLPKVEVKATSEGLLVSLLDDAKFGMFEVGSAKPRPELVLMMGKISNILKSQTGNIVVRGHTDSRAYRSANYDNWRLSSARAQMAYYMLVRGGIPASRFVAIEGRADRDPKVPSDTEAAENRRIDILIKADKQ